MTALLSMQNVSVSYGGVRAIEDVSLEVSPGEIVAVLGANGAGKTTTLLTLAGELTPDEGAVCWNGVPTRAPLYKRARDGLAYIADDRSVFMDLTARDNLRVGGCDIDEFVRHAPELREHLNRRTGLLSGGQQQILTVFRALARQPKVLLADELSLGLAPMIVNRLLDTIRKATETGLGVVLVEQQVRKALSVADRVCVLRNGSVEFSGTGAEARREVGRIEAAYLAKTTTPA